jgi:hypothetical protein
MTDIEAAEKVLAQLADQKDRASEQVSKIAARRQVLAYAVLARADKKAQDELAVLNQQLADLAVTVGDIDGAVAEARRRLDAAQRATSHEIATGHTKRLLELISNLEETAGPLDTCLGKMVAGQMGGLRYSPGLANPPLLLATGNKLASIVQELTALGLDRGVKWPPGRWDRAHVADLRIELQAFVEHFGRLPAPSGRNFAGLIGVLVAGVKAALAQHEQTNREAA